ncbi:MAG TPA: DNA-processing protein DprA [Candidatus Paceibacterota bacterium]|nr:DNA-processing protein DprA [Candidatus Paceibacterota bacterium]
MTQFHIETIDPLASFPYLAETPEPPKSFSIRGSLESIKGKKIVAIVGSRKCSSYGKAVCRMLVEGLRGYPVVIVSGLALGIDSVAHQAALDVGLTTISFPGSGLDWNVLYPAQHRGLAENILRAGGALISEYKNNQRGAIWTFPRRNRIVAGIADIVIIVEAEEKSGALITARLGIEYNKIVGVVPGPVTSPSSKGTNGFLKIGAVPIIESADILREIGLEKETKRDDDTITNSDEERVLALLSQPKTREHVINELSLSAAQANIIFSTLEIKGMIRETLGMIERL